jgi:queuine tRNA-ribosyltransferase
MYFSFELIHRSRRSRARVGRIHTPHGIIETPNFVPVATNGALKAVDSIAADAIGIQLMFCNTYHLLLHPGADIVAAGGGLHSFIQRRAPIITDSGGFQVFSLMYGGVAAELKSKGTKKQEGGVLKISEEGVLFRSYRDGEKILLTPESSVDAQKKLGADIIIPLDELPPYHIGQHALKKSFERTHRWEERSLNAHRSNPNNQAMYAVVHGGIDPALRAESAQRLGALSFDGYAIGGSLGKNRNEMVAMLKELMPFVPEHAPNHLLGIGDLPSVESVIPLGIDTMDSSHPTKCARHGLLFSKEGSLKIIQGQYRTEHIPLSESCRCMVCATYTRSYIHHLFKAHEPIAATLASIHNLTFMIDLMAEYRMKILNDEI